VPSLWICLQLIITDSGLESLFITVTVTDYDAGIGALIGGYPSALVDRVGDVDPSQVSSDFFTRLQTAPKGVLTNGATWDPVTRTLNVSVTTEMMQATTGAYKVACVLPEDGVTGTGFRIQPIQCLCWR
jgi:hypothetical protein